MPTSETYVRRFCNATCKDGDGLSPEGPHTFIVKVHCCQDDYCNGGRPVSSGHQKQVKTAVLSIAILLTFLLLRVW